MKHIIKNALILFAITLVAGVFLGLVYEVTKSPRAAQEEKSKQEAYKAVFKDADSFKEVDLDSKAVAEYLQDKDMTEKIAVVDEAVSALDAQGNIIGYVITTSSKEGYGGDIQLTVGITNESVVNGISILSINETPGLGMKAKDKAFTDQYANKQVDSFVYTKTGASEDNEIDAISGATITTNAMTNAVNAGIYCFDYLIGGGSGE